MCGVVRERIGLGISPGKGGSAASFWGLGRSAVSGRTKQRIVNAPPNDQRNVYDRQEEYCSHQHFRLIVHFLFSKWKTGFVCMYDWMQWRLKVLTMSIGLLKICKFFFTMQC